MKIVDYKLISIDEKDIDENGFFKVPKRVASIGKFVFQDCKKLRKINLNDVEIIEQWAFYGCSNLKDINLEKIRKIYKFSFVDCSSLKESDIKKINDFHLQNKIEDLKDEIKNREKQIIDIQKELKEML